MSYNLFKVTYKYIVILRIKTRNHAFVYYINHCILIKQPKVSVSSVEEI